MLLTSATVSRLRPSTPQKKASFMRVASSMASRHRHSTTSGWMPALIICRTLCCVGFVFCSPDPSTGTRLTCTKLHR